MHTSVPEWLQFLAAFALAAFANWQAVEAYHHGSLFTQLRARLESRRDWISELSECPFCLSHWTGLVLSAIGFVYWTWGLPALPNWLLFPLFWLAVVRASNAMNDLMWGRTRTPNRKAWEVQDERRTDGES